MMLEPAGQASSHEPLLQGEEDVATPLADRKPKRSKSFYDTAMSAALFMASGDEMGENPAFEVKHAEATAPPPKGFRIMDRKAPFRQSKGEMNIHRVNRDQELFRLDPFHTIMELSTCRLLVTFWVLYCLTFAIFAIIYWMSSHRCGIGCDTYPEALLLSVETMLTIGYGVPDPYFRSCPWLVVVLIAESLTAVVYDVIFVGVVYQRISRGTTRASTILFSDKAIIRTIGDSTYLMFRACEMHRTQLLDSHFRCYLFTWHRLEPDMTGQQVSRFRQTPMRLELPDDSLGGQALLILPTTVVHRIDAFSPLLDLGARKLQRPLDAMSRQAEFAPLQRSSDTQVGCRDGAWCVACGQTYPGIQQLRRHVEYTADEEAREGAGYAPHSELLRSGLDGDAAEEDIRSQLMDRMQNLHMEVVCILEGVDAKTSSSVQVRHSYTVQDMVWDSDFAPCVYAVGNQEVTIDFARFHDLVPCV
uniref:Inward rectifier potassium channel C-terminal domain-containing protein n=1 Tax=Alexandrium catenella TaxID=2925 RepID=A0A7S1LLP9_ALECA